MNSERVDDYLDAEDRREDEPGWCAECSRRGWLWVYDDDPRDEVNTGIDYDGYKSVECPACEGTGWKR